MDRSGLDKVARNGIQAKYTNIEDATATGGAVRWGPRSRRASVSTSRGRGVFVNVDGLSVGDRGFAVLSRNSGNAP